MSHPRIQFVCDIEPDPESYFRVGWERFDGNRDFGTASASWRG